ncbi:MAG: metal-sensitive transcriptional regulator [Candidatus Obscuribacterales bacterium]|nr:metal-sensitive transcriptional regulator [Candidatus Obscuribacterales bacterium]
MPITDIEKEKIKARLGKASGHLKHVYQMVDDKKYCIDVLQQLKAVQAALDKVGEIILRQHLQTCVVEAIQKQDSNSVIEELVQVFRHAPTLYQYEDETTELPSSSSNRDCCH